MATTPTTPTTKTSTPTPAKQTAQQITSILAPKTWEEYWSQGGKKATPAQAQAEFKKLQEELKKAQEAEAKTLKEAEKKAAAPPKQPTVKPELIIARTPYPKWWKDSLNATIDLTAPGSKVLANVSGNLRLYVATIVLTVTGPVAITFGFGTAGSSGPIYLGGDNQPFGIVIAMGNSPAPCGSGSLTISAADLFATNPSIGGFATVFVEQAPPREKTT
jgi:hypothetical protein